jgi:HEAT repeat protein
VRLGAVESLSELEDPGAVPAIRKLLRDPRAEVREAATEAVADLLEEDD